MTTNRIIKSEGGIDMLDNKTIGARFKEIRDKTGLTQGQIAVFLNVDQSMISKCEKGERQFSLDILEKAGSLFGCPLDYFISAESAHVPFEIAFRASSVSNEDLEAISVINRLALNLKDMNRIMNHEQD